MMQGRRRTFWSGEVQHVAVLLEHVDLLDTRNGLHVQLLQRTLQLLVVVRCRCLRLLDDLTSYGALSTYRAHAVHVRTYKHIRQQ